MWNPFRVYLAWRSAERAADRAVLVEGITMLKAAFVAQQAQSEAFRVFLEGFKVTEPPQERHWDETADDLKYLDDRGLLPDDVKEADEANRYKALIGNIDKFQLHI